MDELDLLLWSCFANLMLFIDCYVLEAVVTLL